MENPSRNRDLRLSQCLKSAVQVGAALSGQGAALHSVELHMILHLYVSGLGRPCVFELVL